MRSVLALFILSLCVTGFAKPTTYDVSYLLSDLNQVALLRDAPLTPGSKLRFVDKVPGANWKHPALFQIVSSRGQVIKEIPANLPPPGLDEAKILDGDIFTPPPPAQFNLNDLQGALRVKNPEQKFAVLLNGSGNQRHWNDFAYLYRVLTQVYGYHRAQIFVADSRNIDKAPDLDGDGQADISLKSDFASVKALFEKLKTTLKADSELLLVVNDHGSVKDNESTIIFEDTEVKVSEFKKLYDTLPAEQVLAIYEQCYSGGFVRPSVGSKKVSMAASTERELSWANPELTFDEFLYHLISAFAMQAPDGKRIDSDLNKDGRVSAKEAFAYAAGKDRTEESPLLEADSNSGMADKVGF